MGLRNCFTPKEVREALRTLPKTLTETYDKILDSVPKRSYIRAALQWIACSVRPLSLEELAVAAVIDPAVAKPNASENQLRGGGETIRKMLSKLIDVQKVERASLWDFFTQRSRSKSWFDLKKDFNRSCEYPNHIVVFSHSSVRDYLLQRHDDASISCSFSFSEDMAHRFIAKSCFALIQCATASVVNEAHGEGLRSLLMYIARHWHTHAARLPDEEPGSLARLLNEEPLAVKFLLLAKDEHRDESFEDIVGFEQSPTKSPSPGQKLQYAACSGLKSGLNAIIASNPDLDVDASTEAGETALSFACERGHWQIASTLLKRGADPNKHGGMFVPLICASEHGVDDIVRELIDHGADVNVECEYFDECTPLLEAIKAGHLSTIELLLLHGADPNDFGIPISVAARYGKHECMDLLLKYGASVMDNDSPSLLEYAAGSGSVETVKLLLTQGLDVKEKNCLGYAAASGSVEMMKLLLTQGSDVNEKNCLKPLTRDAMLPASIYELSYPWVTISNGKSGSEASYSYGSAIHAAAAYGHTEVIKVLVENNAAVNRRSHYWETPSTLAKLRGHEKTLEYLVGKGGVALEQTEVCYRQDLFERSSASDQRLRFLGSSRRQRR